MDEKKCPCLKLFDSFDTIQKLEKNKHAHSIIKFNFSYLFESTYKPERPTEKVFTAICFLKSINHDRCEACYHKLKPKMVIAFHRNDNRLEYRKSRLMTILCAFNNGYICPLHA